MPQRKLGNWIGAFLEYAAGRPTPEPFLLWTAISTVASALQRNVHMRVVRRIQFPNLYVILVGPPGIGKSVAIKSSAEEIIPAVPSIRCAPQKITSEAFSRDMAESMQVIYLPDGTQEFVSPYTAMLSEFGVFVRAGETKFMSELADLYDNPPTWGYKSKHQGEDDVQQPCFNMLGGATPFILKERFSEEALQQGLPARCLMVYSDQSVRPALELDVEGEILEDAEGKGQETLRQELIHDLECINQLRGRFRWTREAAAVMEAWKESGYAPVPSDPKLAHYCERRVAHITKLCMSFSAARGDDLLITDSDMKVAKETLLNAESVMPKCLSLVTTHELAQVQTTVARMVKVYYERRKAPLPEVELRGFLIRQVNPKDVPFILRGLIDAGVLTYQGEEPNRFFAPGKQIDEMAG